MFFIFLMNPASDSTRGITGRLIEALKQLRDAGNSVIVVEHDKEMILSADHVIDMGPGAGRFGGLVVAQGNPEEMMKHRIH